MKTEALAETSGLEGDNVFNAVSIGIASTDRIRSWSKGQVKNPETINYRTFKPEPNGLFCQRIFGPVRDYECACGKYKRIKFKDIVCDRCGVEVTVSRVRRERMGHIELAVPVVHIWFLKSLPSRLGLILDMTTRDLERVVYYESYIVIEPGKTPLEALQLLNEHQYLEACAEYGHDSFQAKIGAGALRDVLTKVDLEEQISLLAEEMHATRSKQNKKKLSRRLKLAQALFNSQTRPEWMICEVIPVLPPDLRPLVPLEGGRFATSDLNDLYRRVINRNNRLKNLLQLKTPDVIVHNEKRMLQEAVDALFDNGRHSRSVSGAGNRALKSLSDILKGKQGRFRQNLLGKRVDYSGRSVIVIGPELKLHQCGLPKKMALTLFEAFIIRRLRELNFAHTVRGARKMIEKRSPEVWDILEEVTKGHPVLLNRAPTLHRLSIQAFEPQLIEGNAIRLHPLVCAAYNADFDGDQMAVHVPLSLEAIMEAKLLMLSTHNVFSPSNGKAILTPSQDIVLGIYYLTAEPKRAMKKGEGMPLFAKSDEALFAKQSSNKFSYHTPVRFLNPDFGKDSFYGKKDKKIILTTLGRIVFNEIWPQGTGFINFPVTKKELGDIIMSAHKVSTNDELVLALDHLKEIGFSVATEAGISVSIGDMIIPKSKEETVGKARDKLAELERQYRKGIITSGERYNKIIDVWTGATDEIADAVFREIDYNEGSDQINPVFLMMDSGARGNRQQVRQLCGTRGLMAKPSGEIIERPILSSFREGLSVLEYFISTHGARKGLADTALKTADAGYLTRKLCDVSMDCVIDNSSLDESCGVWKQPIYDGDDEIVSLKERIVGRCASGDILNPNNPKEILSKSGELISEETARRIDELGVNRVRILSPLTHMAKNQIPNKCYGVDLATGCLVRVGTAVGIIAAQSIGEPGTQLTMRTFHVGGIASQVFRTPEIRVRQSGILKYKGLRLVETADEASIVLNKNGSVFLTKEDGRVLEEYKIVPGAILPIADGSKVKKGTIVAAWDPHNIPILSEKGGTIGFDDMILGATIKRELDSSTGRIAVVVIEHKEELNPQIMVMDKTDKPLAYYTIPVGAQVTVTEGDIIEAGALLAKMPRQASKTQDITGGLPRVAELFEARRPKEAAEMAKIDGAVSFSGTLRGKKRLIITDKDSGNFEEHLIPHGKHIVVQADDVVYRGQRLTEGSVDPHEILEILGEGACQEYLISEIQKVYRMQGVAINDKHIELIIARMLRKVCVADVGDSDYFWGEQVDRTRFQEERERVLEAGGKGPVAHGLLMGVTKASLETESFISAASFQDTTRVLTEAATMGRMDKLSGFKENVIMGQLIPAGTGLKNRKGLRVNPLVAPPISEESSGEPRSNEAPRRF